MKDGKDWNLGHPDHEGVMAVTHLHRMIEMAEELLEIVGEDDELPGWVQYKFTRAYNDLSDAYGYMDTLDHVIAPGGEPRDMDDEMSVEMMPMDMDMMGDDMEEPGVSLEKEGLGEGKKKKGMWYYINRNKKKKGHRPAKPGDPDRPDPKTWKKLTGENSAPSAELRRLIERLVAEELRK